MKKKSTLLVRNIKYTEILEFLKKLRIIELFQLNFYFLKKFFAKMNSDSNFLIVTLNIKYLELIITGGSKNI